MKAIAMRLRAAAAGLLAAVSLAGAGAAQAAGNANVAALQVALRSRLLYAGAVDGIAGPATRAAVRALQRRAGLAVDGVAGPRTRAALGRYGRRLPGSRPLRRGLAGWDVAALQFRLAFHGFPSGPLDGRYGPRTEAAVRRFQRWARLGVDGVAGPATLGALRAARPRQPLRLRRPLAAAPGDRFGPRGNRFHAGVDFPARAGAPVRAAAGGRVVRAGWAEGGWGYLVVVAHGRGVRTWYAHLSSVRVPRGQRVAAGTVVGRVGATGSADGPHLHFEVRVRGAAVDPLP